jgi:hypothetical protein
MGKLLLLAVLGGIAAVLAANRKDIQRYAKMRSM